MRSRSRPRRTVRRRIQRRRRMRLSGSLSRNVHAYSRHMAPKTIDGQIAAGFAVLDGKGATTFKFNELINYTEFTSLYDQYKITYVKIKMFYRFTSSEDVRGVTAPAGGVSQNTAPQLPRLFYYVDYDDDTSPATVNEIRENSKCVIRQFQMGKPITIRIRPRTAGLIFNGLTSAYDIGRRSWINCAYPDVPHYGLKWAVEDMSRWPSTGAGLPNIVWETKVWFKCRQPR